MNHRQILHKGQFETFKLKQGITQIGSGPYGSFAHPVDPGTRLKEINETYGAAREYTTEMKTKLDSSSNMIARFFAKRRYDKAIRREVDLVLDTEINEELIRIIKKDQDG
jgi:hypothetical protein